MLITAKRYLFWGFIVSSFAQRVLCSRPEINVQQATCRVQDCRWFHVFGTPVAGTALVSHTGQLGCIALSHRRSAVVGYCMLGSALVGLVVTSYCRLPSTCSSTQLSSAAIWQVPVPQIQLLLDSVYYLEALMSCWLTREMWSMCFELSAQSKVVNLCWLREPHRQTLLFLISLGVFRAVCLSVGALLLLCPGRGVQCIAFNVSPYMSVSVPQKPRLTVNKFFSACCMRPWLGHAVAAAAALQHIIQGGSKKVSRWF